MFDFRYLCFKYHSNLCIKLSKLDLCRRRRMQSQLYNWVQQRRAKDLSHVMSLNPNKAFRKPSKPRLRLSLRHRLREKPSIRFLRAQCKRMPGPAKHLVFRPHNWKLLDQMLNRLLGKPSQSLVPYKLCNWRVWI